jgi:hypothetical protein
LCSTTGKYRSIPATAFNFAEEKKYGAIALVICNILKIYIKLNQEKSKKNLKFFYLLPRGGKPASMRDLRGIDIANCLLRIQKDRLDRGLRALPITDTAIPLEAFKRNNHKEDSII